MDKMEAIDLVTKQKSKLRKVKTPLPSTHPSPEREPIPMKVKCAGLIFKNSVFKLNSSICLYKNRFQMSVFLLNLKRVMVEKIFRL